MVGEVAFRNCAFGFKKMLPGGFQHGFDSLDSRSNQFQENRAFTGRRKIRIAGPARLGNLADRGDAVTEALPQSHFYGRATLCRHAGPMPDHAAEPLDEPYARKADRTGQIAEFQMCMGVDQSGHDGHLAQVFDRHIVWRTADSDNPALGNGYGGVAKGWPGYGKDPTGPQTSRRRDVGVTHKRQTAKYTEHTKVVILLPSSTHRLPIV